MNKERLRNVIRALRESPNPKEFSMLSWGRCCGTPVCAVGHYVFRKDLQDTYVLRIGEIYKTNGTRLGTDIFKELAGHFDLNMQEIMNLFGSGGCGQAETIEEATTYIEDFIASKQGVEEAVEELIESETVLK